MTKIGVCLSGCGVNDDAEIHESVITALALDRAGASIIYTAPNVIQKKVVDHYSGNEMYENRNVLVESARIARGDITDLVELTADDMDGLIFPGGFGAVLNLCDFALKGADCDIHPEVHRIIQEILKVNKPLGFICIAPALFARAAKSSEKTIKILLAMIRQLQLILKNWEVSMKYAPLMILLWTEKTKSYLLLPICWQAIFLKPLQALKNWFIESWN